MRDLRFALMYGTTRTTAMLVAIGTILHGFGVMTQTWWIWHAPFNALRALLPLHVWCAVYVLVGAGMAWRVLSDNSSPKCAWVINILMAVAWCLTVGLKFYFAGITTILSTHTAFALAALWLLIRTEATPIDREVA